MCLFQQAGNKLPVREDCDEMWVKETGRMLARTHDSAKISSKEGGQTETALMPGRAFEVSLHLPGPSASLRSIGEEPGVPSLSP